MSSIALRSKKNKNGLQLKQKLVFKLYMLIFFKQIVVNNNDVFFLFNYTKNRNLN